MNYAKICYNKNSLKNNKIIMTNIEVLNVPKSFSQKFWQKVDFQEILWIYWDGMDWCKYGKIIPSKEDLIALEKSNNEIFDNDWKKFLENLITK